MRISVPDLWQKVINNIKLSVTPETYNLWISPIKPLTLENNIFTLEVPNIYFSQWITNNKKNIEQILSDLCGQQIALELKPHQNISDIIKKVEDMPDHEDVRVLIMQKDQINPKYVFSGFVIGASNRFAHGCSEAVAKNPGKQFNPLFLYSGVGLGKTHLLNAIGNHIKQSTPKLKALYVTCEKFVTEFIELIRFDKISFFKSKYRSLVGTKYRPCLMCLIGVFRLHLCLENFCISLDIEY
ncbi:hypothetical protein AGMMS49573_03820 [Endomicrobiia bacterium]|nr:hypothetical protein AGMMS49573_03820 [Endomicrobiia bacterium]